MDEVRSLNSWNPDILDLVRMIPSSFQMSENQKFGSNSRNDHNKPLKEPEPEPDHDHDHDPEPEPEPETLMLCIGATTSASINESLKCKF